MIRKIFAVLVIFSLVWSIPACALDRVELGPEYIPETARSRALYNAKIYVGDIDTDPTVVGNQKTLSVQQEDGSIVTVSQPIRTNAGGIPVYNGSPVTLLTDGNYSLKILDSSDNQIYYVPSVAYPLPKNIYSYMSDYDSLADAVADIGATPTLLVIDEDVTMGQSSTIPSTLGLYFIPGNTITTTGYLLIVNSYIYAGQSQLIFEGTGSTALSGSNIEIGYAAWWGVTTSASAADNATRLNEALSGGPHLLQMGVGAYNIGASITFTGPVHLKGIRQISSSLGTYLTFTQTDGSDCFSASSTSNIYMSDMYITESGTVGSGISLTAVDNSEFKNLEFFRMDDNGIEVLGDSDNNRFTNITVSAATNAAFSLDDVASVVPQNTTFTSCFSSSCDIGYELLAGDNTQILGGEISSSTTYGIQVEETTDVTRTKILNVVTEDDVFMTNGVDVYLNTAQSPTDDFIDPLRVGNVNNSVLIPAPLNNTYTLPGCSGTLSSGAAMFSSVASNSINHCIVQLDTQNEYVEFGADGGNLEIPEFMRYGSYTIYVNGSSSLENANNVTLVVDAGPTLVNETFTLTSDPELLQPQRGVTFNMDLNSSDQPIYIRATKANADADQVSINYILIVPEYDLIHREGSFDPPNVAAAGYTAMDITVTGAETGDFALCSYNGDVLDLITDCTVTAADTVTWVIYNPTVGAINLPSSAMYIRVKGGNIQP